MIKTPRTKCLNKRNNRTNSKNTKTNFKVFVGCIPGEVEESTLKRFFRSLGNITGLSIKFNNQAQKVNAGYCIVNCKDEKTFKKLTTGPIYFHDRKLECRPYLDKSQLGSYKEDYNLRRVYIYNILEKTTDMQMKAMFERVVGPVENAYCIRDKVKNKNSLIFGYVLFKEKIDAQRAVKMKRISFRGQNIKIKEFLEKGKQKEYKKPNNGSGGAAGENYFQGRDSVKKIDRNEREKIYYKKKKEDFSELRGINDIPSQFYSQRPANYNPIPRITNNNGMNNGLNHIGSNTNNRIDFQNEQVGNEVRGKNNNLKYIFELGRPIWKNHEFENLRFNRK